MSCDHAELVDAGPIGLRCAECNISAYAVVEALNGRLEEARKDRDFFDAERIKVSLAHDALIVELAEARRACKEMRELAAKEDADWLAEMTKRNAELAATREELRQVREWEDVKDEWSDAISAAHPTRSGSHAEYGIAMQMVSHRHGKFSLVELVNWLLVEVKRKAANQRDTDRG